MKVVLNTDGAAGRGPFVLPPHAKQGNPDMSETAHGLKDFIAQTKDRASPCGVSVFMRLAPQCEAGEKKDVHCKKQNPCN